MGQGGGDGRSSGLQFLSMEKETKIIKWEKFFMP